MAPDLENNDVELNGLQNDAQYRSLMFGIKRCQPELNDCASEKEIDEYVNSLIIYGGYIEQSVNFALFGKETIESFINYKYTRFL